MAASEFCLVSVHHGRCVYLSVQISALFEHVSKFLLYAIEELFSLDATCRELKKHKGSGYMRHFKSYFGACLFARSANCTVGCTRFKNETYPYLLACSANCTVGRTHSKVETYTK
jgi:hypothetical protein